MAIWLVLADAFGLLGYAGMIVAVASASIAAIAFSLGAATRGGYRCGRLAGRSGAEPVRLHRRQLAPTHSRYVGVAGGVVADRGCSDAPRNGTSSV